MNYKLFLILKLDWINSDVQLRMLMFLTLLLLLDLHQITMIICCMWCSVYYLFCLTKRMAVHSVSLLQLCWDCSMLISIENRFKWIECLLLRQGIYGPLFTCPLSRPAGLCVTQQWWHRSAAAGEKIIVHFGQWGRIKWTFTWYASFCAYVCVWMVMQRWMHVKWTSLSHQAFASTLWRRKGGTSHQERANHILAVWIYARPFGL